MGGRGQKMEPQQLFQFTWQPYAIDPKIDYSKETPTLVEFRLEPTASGTLLLLTESGLTDSCDRRVSFPYERRRWTQQLKNIEEHVAKTS